METINLMRKLPIGVQTFEDIRKDNYLYVDKTAFVWRMANQGKPYFLSRPRRFGKSLLLSTFEAYFQGRKDLFEGLAIEQMETEWKKYPVLHLDLNAKKYEKPADLIAMLNQSLEKWEALYGDVKKDRYTAMRNNDQGFYIGKFVDELESGNYDAFLNLLQAFFADFPYQLNAKTERHYQVVFYLVFKLMGQFTGAEVQSAHGHADAVVKTPKYIYVFEFKLNGTAEEALKQIDEKDYLIPYQADGRKVIKIGVEFSAKKRNISRWLV